MNERWARIGARVPGLMVGALAVIVIRNAEGFPWVLPVWVAVLGAIVVGVVLEHIITLAINTYFGFNDDEDDDDGPDEDDDPDEPIIVPDSPRELLEPVR